MRALLVHLALAALPLCGCEMSDGDPPDDEAADAVADLAGASPDQAVALSDGGVRDLASPLAADLAQAGPCPEHMALVGGTVCIDVYEARLVERRDGGELPWPPTHAPDGIDVRAVVVPGTPPQGYISGAQAEKACQKASKRLCTVDEWLAACRGPQKTTYPYGNTYIKGACNEGRAVHPVVQLFGANEPNLWDNKHLNDPKINEQANTVASGGQYAQCVSAWKVFDLHGNLHEWVSDPNGTFKGGFYVDAKLNGAGCLYTTTAHTFSYHDYSTGFRCCAAPK
ncbi:MAG: hypothetical protein EXR72_20585 [Myxococcales bacterium]|nr:hypothetical protein [Myxococcales bacterium]